MKRQIVSGKDIRSLDDIEAIEQQWSLIRLKYAVFRYDSDRWVQIGVGPVNRDRILEMCQSVIKEVICG